MRTNKEADTIIAHAVRSGLDVTINDDDDDLLTVTVNAGLPGWVDVSYIVDHWSHRVRRVASTGVTALPDGTEAERIHPATKAQILDVIDTLAATAAQQPEVTP